VLFALRHYADFIMRKLYHDDASFPVPPFHERKVYDFLFMYATKLQGV
jgi:hypothetical protein